MNLIPPYKLVSSLCLLSIPINLKLVAATQSLVSSRAHAFKPKQMTSFDSIPSVEIDPEGTFKYILIKLYEKGVKNEDGSEKFKYLVRGKASCEWHGDIYDLFNSNLSKKLDTECVGGGRIKHNPEEKKIFIYGHSQGFGKADHSITKQLLVEKYPDYAIDWSDEGY